MANYKSKPPNLKAGIIDHHMKPHPNTESHTQQLQRRNRELSILNSIAEAINRSVDLDQALQVTLAQVADLFDLHTGWVWLVHDETSQTYLAAAQNLPPALANNPESMHGSCYCLDTYQAGIFEGAANVNVIICSRLRKFVDGTDGLRYHSSIPLYAHGKPLGVLNVASTDWRELTSDDLRLLYTIGDMLSIAIERARLFANSAEIGAVEERNRLAREIHDTLAQGLSAIALQLETADALIEANASSEQIQQALNQALSLTRVNLEEARRSVLDLRAATLEGRTLPQVLESLAENYNSKGLFRATYKEKGPIRPLPVRIETGIYRIAQEALVNVAQHANASQVLIRLITKPSQVTFSVEDDGIGFDPNKIPDERFGLIGLNERAKLLGGNLQIRSSPNEGTKVIVHIPIP
jgi:two-component system NarL family sensor kinase